MKLKFRTRVPELQKALFLAGSQSCSQARKIIEIHIPILANPIRLKSSFFRTLYASNCTTVPFGIVGSGPTITGFTVSVFRSINGTQHFNQQKFSSGVRHSLIDSLVLCLCFLIQFRIWSIILRKIFYRQFEVLTNLLHKLFM